MEPHAQGRSPALEQAAANSSSSPCSTQWPSSSPSAPRPCTCRASRPPDRSSSPSSCASSCTSVATLLAIQILRSPQVPDNSVHPGHGQFSADMLHDLGHLGTRRTPRRRDDAPIQTPAKTWKTYSDWRTVGLMLRPASWPSSRSWNRWAGSSARRCCSGWSAYALGSHRRLFDIGVGLLFSSIIQLAFGAGLGLSLPSGFIGGIL